MEVETYLEIDFEAILVKKNSKYFIGNEGDIQNLTK